MKHFLKLLTALIILSSIYSCKKEETFNGVSLKTLNNGVTTCEYAPFTLGSTFTYEAGLPGNITEVTWETGDPETINNKTFIKVNNFSGSEDIPTYFNCEDGEYNIIIQNVAGISGNLDLIYLKENVPVNTTWQDTVFQSNSGTTTLNRYNWTYIEKKDNHTVKGNTYSDIIHINLVFTVEYDGFILTTDETDYYWARGVGLVESLGTNVNYQLVSHSIEE